MKQTTAENSKIKECVCTHDYQDSKHGKQMRVMNPTTKKEGEKAKYRCTVCGREHS